MKVTITLWTGSGPGTSGMACIQMAGYYEVIAQLQAPLGGRPPVDGAAWAQGPSTGDPKVRRFAARPSGDVHLAVMYGA